MSRWCIPAWEAFQEITNDRPVGMALGPIPWTAIDRYAIRHGIDDPDDFAEFCEQIRALDSAWLQFQSNRHQK